MIKFRLLPEEGDKGEMNTNLKKGHLYRGGSWEGKDEMNFHKEFGRGGRRGVSKKKP